MYCSEQISRKRLEAMQLDRISVDALLRQEPQYLRSLVSLQLDHSSHILVFNQRSIACELLSVVQPPCPSKPIA